MTSQDRLYNAILRLYEFYTGYEGLDINEKENVKYRLRSYCKTYLRLYEK